MNTQYQPIGYVVFLRGINVGGHKQVKMDELKKTFVSLGFKNVQTLLNSGNVLFETSETNPIHLTKKISETLKKTFGWEIGVILRSREEIQQLIKTNPFKDIRITSETRWYVTFLSDASQSKNNLKIPYESPEKDFKIIRVTNKEVCSVLTLSPKHGSTGAMEIIEKEYGKQVTTRNWNTAKKIVLD